MPRPANCNVDINSSEIQDAVKIIQSSYRGHSIRKEIKNKGRPKFLEELSDLTIVEGSAARIDAKISGFPDPSVKWYKDGKEIIEDNKYKVEFEENHICALIISSVGEEEVGSYSCRAFNVFGETFDCAKVFLQVSAKIVKGPESVKLQRGATLILEATVSGDPDPEVGWAKNDEDLEEDDRITYEIEKDITMLTIKDFKKKDVGRYEVYAENSAGSDHAFCDVEME